MYLLDANAFMEANRLYYAFDIAPRFWTRVRKATRPPRNPPRDRRGRPNRRHS